MEVLTLGEKIKKRRTELNLTLKDLAGDKVTPGQISLVESGKSNPSMDLLSYISEFLDIPINYLMETERAQAEEICRYYRNMAEVNLSHKNLSKAKDYIDKSCKYIEKYDLEISKAKNLYLKALYEIEVGNSEKAFEYIFQCNVIYSKNNYIIAPIKNFILIAKTFSSKESLSMAISYFHKSESLFSTGEITDEFLLSKIYYNLAVLYRKKGDRKKSTRYMLLAKEKIEFLEDKISYSKRLSIMSEEFEKSGDVDNALKYSRMSLDLVNEYEKEHEKVEMEYNLGILYYDLENYEEALKHFTKILPFFESKLKDDLIELQIKRAFCLAKTDEKDACLELISQIDEMIVEEDFENTIKLFKLKYYVNEIYDNKKEAYRNLILALNIAKYKKLTKQEYEILMIISNHFINREKEYYGYKYLDLAIEKKNQISGGE